MFIAGRGASWQAFPRRAWEREYDIFLFREWSGADFPKRLFREWSYADFPKRLFREWSYADFPKLSRCRGFSFADFKFPTGGNPRSSRNNDILESIALRGLATLTSLREIRVAPETTTFWNPSR